MPPLIRVAVAWLVGLVVAHHWLVPVGVEPMWLLLLGLVPVLCIILWFRDRSMVLGGFCALALLLGALRYQYALPDLESPEYVTHYNERGWVVVEGVVRSYPDVGDVWTGLDLKADRIEAGGAWRTVRGRVLVRAPRYSEYEYGDRLVVAGFLETPPVFDGFSYRDYLARKGIHSMVSRPRIQKLASQQASPFWVAIYQVKDRARNTIATLMPDPEASVLQGILLGIDSGIPPDLYDDYNTTGTSHIIVISGANLIVVAAVLSFAFGRLLGRRRAFWFVTAGIVVYVLLVGADAAVVRAGVMAVLLLTARYLGRLSTAYVSLFAAAAFLTIVNPFLLWDVGFQLSFAASLGLILFALPMQRCGEGILGRVCPWQTARSVGLYLVDVLAITLAALFLTTPLMLYTFGRLSLVAPLANVLISPVQPLIMGLGGAATSLGMVPFLAPVAQIVGWAAWLCLAYTNTVVRWMAAWPMASFETGPIHPLVPILFYSSVAAGVAWSRRRGGLGSRGASAGPASSRTSTKVMLAGGLAAVVLVWLAVLQLPDGRLHVAFLDVGQGDAILITTPRGEQILVDGGPSPRALMAKLGREMPFWDRRIELVVMTHPDSDHITGLVEVLRRYDVGAWLDNGQSANTALSRECRSLILEKGIKSQVGRGGDRIDLGRGAEIQILHPPAGTALAVGSETNDESLVLRLVWNRTSFLLTGDLEARGEKMLLRSSPTVSADVLKVAHHGSGATSTARFLSAVSPRYAVISVGAENHFGHPDPSVLGRLALSNARVLRTDLAGTIEFMTDGERLWALTEK